MEQTDFNWSACYEIRAASSEDFLCSSHQIYIISPFIYDHRLPVITLSISYFNDIHCWIALHLNSISSGGFLLLRGRQLAEVPPRVLGHGLREA